MRQRTNMAWWDPTSWGDAIVKPIANLIDEVHTSTEEKLMLQYKIGTIIQDIYNKGADLDKLLIEKKAAIIIAEATQGSWLTRSWRPIMMLMFGFCILWEVVGQAHLLPAIVLPERMWDIMELGLGGYVIGRSAEQVVKSAQPLVDSWKGKNNG